LSPEISGASDRQRGQTMRPPKSQKDDPWHTLGEVLRSDAPDHNRKTVREFSEAANIPEETVWRKLRGRLIPDKEPQ
jgi:hypothetical protein